MRRIRPESPEMALCALILAVAVAVASFAVSFTGLISAAGWAGIPPVLRPAVPLVVDLSILVFTVAAVVARARGEDVRLAWSAVAFFTVVSMMTNATHALADDISTAQTLPALIIGAFIAGLMPLACLIATHTAVSVAVAPAQGSKAARQKAERARVEATSRSTVGEYAALAGKQTSKSKKTAPVRTTRGSVDTARVVEMDAAGRSQREIAEVLGTSKSTVQRVLKQSDSQMAKAAVG